MPKNVLIIDGDHDAARFMAASLEAEGYFAFAASSADIGVTMAKRVRPVLILLDPRVKGAGGLEYVSRLRAQESLKDVPIVLLVEGAQDYDPEYEHRYGIMDFISKKPLTDAPGFVSRCEEAIERGKGDSPSHEEKEEDGLPREDAFSAAPDDAFSAGAELPERFSEEVSSPGGAESPARDEERGFDFDSEPKNQEEQFEERNHDKVKKDDDALFNDEEEDEEDRQDDPPVFYGKRRSTKGRPINKNFLLIIVLLLLGAAASFTYFMFLAPAEKVSIVENSAPEAENTIAAEPEIPAALTSDIPVATSLQPPPVEAVRKPIPPAPPKAVEKPIPPAAKAAPNAKLLSPKAAAKPPVAISSHFHSVQLGAFESRQNAENLIKTLKPKGYEAFIIEAGRDGKVFYRVLAGRFNTAEEARVFAVKLGKEGIKGIYHYE